MTRLFDNSTNGGRIQNNQHMTNAVKVVSYVIGVMTVFSGLTFAGFHELVCKGDFLSLVILMQLRYCAPKRLNACTVELQICQSLHSVTADGIMRNYHILYTRLYTYTGILGNEHTIFNLHDIYYFHHTK
jgi:hypothetical protein